MSAVISLPYLNAIKGANNGLATLDGSGKVPASQLPSSATETYKGQFATSVLLIAAFPAASLADYAYVTATNSYWYWNAGLAVPAWVNQEITATAYNALIAAAQTAVPYVIVGV